MAEPTALLPNIIWHTLSGPHAHLSSGTPHARRYSTGFSSLVAFADKDHPDFDALLPYCEEGEHFYVDGWSGPAPQGWQIDADKAMYKMVWHGELPAEDAAPLARRLGPQDAQQAFDLAALTKPGPFGLRTIELGEYFGLFDGERLMAMAGERLQAGTLREISGVCTHPDYRGRGLTHQLMLKLLQRQQARGQTSFLHVMTDNHVAHEMYLRMGFRDYLESVVRVVSRS